MDNGASSYRRFLDGDEAAFDEILKEYRTSLTRFIDRIVHDTAAAEDITIDVFTYILVHRRRYNFRVSLKTYLFMIGRCRALDYIKHRGKLIISKLEEAITISSGDSSPEELVIAGERKRNINLALDTLPEDMRTAVYLVYFEQLSYKEAARIMKKSVKQVDNLLYRAKTALRSVIGKDGELLI